MQPRPCPPRHGENGLIQLDTAKSAAEELLAAAMLGEGWAEGLQQLADATNAGGASLVRVKGGCIVAHLSSTAWAEHEAQIVADRAPPGLLRFYPDHVYGNGFCVDRDAWTDDEISRDPYFQEFLRPRGVFWHAKLRLCAAHAERVSLTLKRRIELGPYEPADIAILDLLAPTLQTAFRIGRRMLDAEASGMTRLLHDRGDPVFELDSLGRVLRAHGDAERLGVRVRERRLILSDRPAQPRLDQAVAAAAGAPQPALVAASNRHGERSFLQVLPVTGRGRDVFLATAVIVLVKQLDRPARAPRPDLIRQALGLTEREAEIAALLAEGSSLPDIAERLNIGIGTARNHVKSIFGKTGAGRQGELVALLCSMQL
jgi:DNA-binding CsgD family transcriptional regulator